MRREQFMRELKEALEGRLPESDVAEILADHNEFFDAGLAEGNTEEQVAERLGDPAKIALSLLRREGIQDGSQVGLRDGLQGGSQHGSSPRHTGVPKADISRRVAAFVIDALVPVLPFLWFAPNWGIVSFFCPQFMLALVPSLLSTVRVSNHSWIASARGFWQVAVVASLVWFVMVNVASLWVFRGRTLGKRMFGLRVIDRAGGAAKPAQFAAREILGKLVINAMCSSIWLPLGFVPPLASLVWSAISPDGMTLWDAIAGTRVADARSERRGD